MCEIFGCPMFHNNSFQRIDIQNAIIDVTNTEKISFKDNNTIESKNNESTTLANETIQELSSEKEQTKLNQ